MNTLSDLDLFNGCPPESIEDLTRRSWQVRGETDSPIYFADDSANLVYFLLSGRVRLFYETSGNKEITLDFLEAGEMFGEISISDMDVRGEAAEAVEESLLEVVPADHCLDVMKQHPDLFERIFKRVSRRRWRVQNRLKSLAYDEALKRVIYVLLDQAGVLSDPTARDDEISLQFTHQELADMAGLTRPTTTNQLNALKKDDYLRLDQGEIVIQDVDALIDQLDLVPTGF